jgi:hypothetical protein
VKIILDENLPKGLARLLAPRRVTTVQEEGYAGYKNGRLIAELEGVFDIFITADKNLRYQQNLSGRHLAIIELPTNRWPLLRLLQMQIEKEIGLAQPGDYLIVVSGAESAG